MTTEVILPGARVSFTTKYGDRATGVYIGPGTVPGPDGPIAGYLVESEDCFGPDHSVGKVRCFLTKLPQKAT